MSRVNNNQFFFKVPIGENLNNQLRAELNEKSIFEYGERFGINLSSNQKNIAKTRKVELTTYGMENHKTFLGKVGQFFLNLRHNIALLRHGSEERNTAINSILNDAKGFYDDLGKNCKGITPQLCGKMVHYKTLKDFQTMVKTFEDYATQLETERDRYTQRISPAHDAEGNYKKLSEAKGILTNIANALKNNLKEYQRQQLRPLLNNAESKILEQLQKSDFSTDNETFQTLNNLNPKNLDKDNFFGDFGEIQTKYNQLCTFRNIFVELDNLKNAESSGDAYAIWSRAKEDLETTYGGNNETAKLLEQRLDEAYTEKIKTTSPDIEALKDCFIKGTEIPKGKLQNARRLCRTIDNKNHKAEALSTYIDDLEKGIDIGNKLSKLNGNISDLKKNNTSLKSEDFNTECKNAEKEMENLRTQLKAISDNDIVETIGSRLFKMADELETAKNRVQIKKDLETLQKEIENLKEYSTNEEDEFARIEGLVTAIEAKINVSDKDEEAILQNLFNEKLSELKDAFNICKKTRAEKILKNTSQSAIPRTSSETYENIKQALDKENENLNAMNNTFKEVIRNNFQGFIKTTLLQHKITPQNKEVFLNKQYKDILSRMKTTFDKTMDGLATEKAKAECQKAYDAMKKEMRDMYVDCYKAIRTLQKATSQNFLKINTATKQSIRNVPNQKNSLKNTSNIQNNVSKLPISSGKSEKQAIENFDKFLNHMLNEANERIMNKKLNAFGEKLNNVFKNAQKTDAFNSIKQEANIQGAKKELDTALTELRKNLDKEYEANRSKMDALNAEKTLSEQDKEMLRTGYKQAHATESLSLYETYKQKVYDTIDTLKKNTPSLSADELEQLEYDYLSAAGMGESTRTYKTD